MNLDVLIKWEYPSGISGNTFKALRAVKPKTISHIKTPTKTPLIKLVYGFIPPCKSSLLMILYALHGNRSRDAE
jgi:hypothetical protein